MLNSKNVTKIAIVLTLALLSLSLASCSSKSAFDLSPGDCFNDGDLASGLVGDVATTDCTEPHDNEVYAIFDMTGDTYPGEDTILEVAQRECLSEFEPYVGIPYMESRLVYYPIYPTQETWESVDDREIVCVFYDTDLAKLTGSMEGSEE